MTTHTHTHSLSLSLSVTFNHSATQIVHIQKRTEPGNYNVYMHIYNYNAYSLVCSQLLFQEHKNSSVTLIIGCDVRGPFQVKKSTFILQMAGDFFKFVPLFNKSSKSIQNSCEFFFFNSVFVYLSETFPARQSSQALLLDSNFSSTL